MTVSSTQARYQYAGNGTTRSFAFPAIFLLVGDLLIDLRASNGDAVETTLNGTGLYDYGIVGTQDAATGEYLSGADVVFNAAPPSGYTVTLFRDPPETQPIDLSAVAKLPTQTLNTGFDRQVLQNQALMDRAVRAVTAPLRDPPGVAGPSMLLPPIAERSGAIMGFDTVGSPTTGGAGSLGVLESLMAESDWPVSLADIAWVTNVAAVRAVGVPASTAPIGVLGYNNAGDKPPVLYVYSTSDSRPDDGGLVLRPNSIDSGDPGRWLLATQGRPFNVLDWGADPSNTNASDTAFANWFAALLAESAAGYIPAGHYKFAEQQAWNLASVATHCPTIAGAGQNRTILDFSAVASSPCLKISGGSIDLFFGRFANIGIIGDLAGTVLQLGERDFGDALNSFIFDGIQVKNSSTSSSACAVESNEVLNSDIFLVANCSGHGDALRLRQTQFCVIKGSHSQADIGEHFTDGYSFGNALLGVDLEVVGTCVQSDIITASRNTWIGGQFVWTGSAGITLNAGSNYFTFLNPNLGVSGTVVTGTEAAIAIILGPSNTGASIGVLPLAGLLVNPASGTDADVVLDAASGQGGFTVMQRAGSQRWEAGMTNADESGGNAGSNYQLTRYTDAGAVIDNPLSIDRSTGIITAQSGIASQGAVGFWGHGLPGSRPSITGSRSSDTVAVLAALLTALDATGIIDNQTTS